MQMSYLPLLLALSGLCSAVRVYENFSAEGLPSLGQYLCRCELKSKSTVVAQRDCVRHWKMKDRLATSLACHGTTEAKSFVQHAAQKAGVALSAGVEIKCSKITIDGNRIESALDAYFLPEGRPLPSGVALCNPKFDKPGALSPFTVFGKDQLKTKTFTIASGSPDKLFASCPARAATESALGDFCDGNKQQLRCCSTARGAQALCRYDTVVGARRPNLWKSTPIHAALPDAVVQSMHNDDKDIGSACCSGQAVFTGLGQWECREHISLAELAWQLDHVSQTYRRHAFVQYVMRIYYDKVQPVEQASLFDQVGEGEIKPGEFQAKPMVLLVGGYSTGKSTFIKNMAGWKKDLPGMHTGAEPTTAKFMVVQNGEEGTVPGSVLVADKNQPFASLNQFGNSFLDRFEGSRVQSSTLQDITYVDTPGVLAGEKQRNRGYDFKKVMEWFADRSHVILLFFDVANIDISDEFGELLPLIMKSGNHHKVRIVLNKADRIEPDSLMRVYGSVLWGLSRKIQNQAEAPKIYIGNFGSRAEFPYKQPDGRPHEFLSLFEMEYKALMSEIAGGCSLVPALTSKLGNLLSRMNRVRAYAYLMQYLRKEMPSMLGGGKQKKLLQSMGTVVTTVAKRHGISRSDFQSTKILKKQLQDITFYNIASDLDKKIATMQTAFDDIGPLQGKVKKFFGGAQEESGVN